MAKTEFLQIRVSPEDRERLVEAAAADYLDVSTWARRVILKALDERAPLKRDESPVKRSSPKR